MNHLLEEISEKHMWCELQKTNNNKLNEYFTKKYYPLVIKISKHIFSKITSSIDLGDLIGYGVFGLIDAINKYNPLKNVDFKYYASIRIRGAIYDGIRKWNTEKYDKVQFNELIFITQTNVPYLVFEQKEIENKVNKCLQKLSDKEKKIIMLYYFENLTMKDIGDALYVSEARISQLHISSLNKLRKELNKMKEFIYE